MMLAAVEQVFTELEALQNAAETAVNNEAAIGKAAMVIAAAEKALVVLTAAKRTEKL